MKIEELFKNHQTFEFDFPGKPLSKEEFSFCAEKILENPKIIFGVLGIITVNFSQDGIDLHKIPAIHKLMAEESEIWLENNPDRTK